MVEVLILGLMHIKLYIIGLKGAARQKEIPTPAVARTWITAYDTPYWKPTVIYNASKIEDQLELYMMLD